MALPARPVLAWALYDWANSAFAASVMAGFFPVFFKQYWAADLAVADSTFWLGVVNSAASLVMVLSAPLLGAFADSSGCRRRFLLAFTALGALATGALFLVVQGHWPAALLLYLAGLLGFSGGNLFYDALLVGVTSADHYDRVSALGYALGYLGGGLLFLFDLVLLARPQWFGLADPAEAVRWAFLGVACWWGLFSVPLFLQVPEPPALAQGDWRAAARDAWARLARTFRHLNRYRPLVWFLVAYWLYIDGVDTVVRMAVDYGLALNFAAQDLMLALLITQFVGFPAALAFGRLGARWGPKRGIMLAIFVYLLVILWAWRMRSAAEFYGLAALIGLVQGGIQALSRSLYARLIPPRLSAEFFGFYNMLGKFAAVIGPLLVGGVALTGSGPRGSILSLALLFVLGAAVLWKVPEGRAT